MPIYEYMCTACGHKLEMIQKMSDAPLTDCPECDKSALKKLVSAAAFRLKGSGWYETDFKSGKKKNIADSGNSAPTDSANSASSSQASNSSSAGASSKSSSSSSGGASSKSSGSSSSSSPAK